MGDRIAVMRQGGRVAQYATPAELLMAPADEFVEDFVGADRALKRLALMRVGDVELWEAPLAYVGQPTSEVVPKLESAEVPFPLLIDSERRPLGWLSERDLAKEIVPQTAGLAAGRPARSRRRPARRAGRPAAGGHPVRPGDRCLRADRRCSLGRDHLRVPRLSGGGERGARTRRSAPMASAAPIAAVLLHNRSHPDCIQRNEIFCPGWVVDNFNRYVDPAVQHVILVLVSVCVGFAIAFALSLLAHRHRWLGRALPRRHRSPLHDPQHRLLLPASPDHRARSHHGDHRPDRLHPSDHLPQRDDRPQQRPA